MSEQNWEGGGRRRKAHPLGSKFWDQILFIFECFMLGTELLFRDWVVNEKYHSSHCKDEVKGGWQECQILSLGLFTSAKEKTTYLELEKISRCELNFVDKYVFLTLLPFYHLLHHFWLVWCSLSFFVLVENTVIWLIILDNNKIKLV